MPIKKKVLKATKTPIESKSDKYRKRASSERSSLYKGLRSIKGDTSQIKQDTSLIKQDTNIIKAQNTLTLKGIETTTENQLKLFGLNNKTLMGVGAVGSAVSGLAIALDEGLKDVLVVQVVIGVMLFVLGAGAVWYIIERQNKAFKVQEQKQELQNKRQELILDKLGIEYENEEKKYEDIPKAYMPNEIPNPLANPTSEAQNE